MLVSADPVHPGVSQRNFQAQAGVAGRVSLEPPGDTALPHTSPQPLGQSGLTAWRLGTTHRALSIQKDFLWEHGALPSHFTPAPQIQIQVCLWGLIQTSPALNRCGSDRKSQFPQVIQPVSIGVGWGGTEGADQD